MLGGGESDRVSEVSLWGEQLDWGAATLPTLSSLSRINDDLRPIRIHERAGLPYTKAWPPTHMHTLPPPHTLSPCLIYTDMISPRHATFILNNAEGRDGCFWFPTGGRHLNGRRLNTPRFCLFKDPQPSLPCCPLVSLQMKWTNAKSMFLVLLITVFIPLSHCFLAD